MTCNKLVFLKTWGGLKVVGRMTFDDDGPAVAASPRTCEKKVRQVAATAENFMTTVCVVKKENKT